MGLLDRFIVSGINELDQLVNFFKYNWTTWNWCLVKLEYENDIILGGYEFTVILLGLGFRVRYNKPIKTQEMIHIEKQMEEIEAGTAVLHDWTDMRKELMKGRCPRCWYKLDSEEDPDGNDNEKA